MRNKFLQLIQISLDSASWELHQYSCRQPVQKYYAVMILLFSYTAENWHQYDGFMEKEQQKWFASFTYWKKKLRAHAEISLQACCESIFEHELVDLSICEKIEILFHAHWKVYGQDAKCWGNISKKQFAKEVNTIRG